MTAPLFGLFFISGLCGLVYEVLWVRQLALVLGHTAAAQGLVLAVFMAGLGLGGLLLGRLADRVSSPLRLFGLLELGVGLLGLASPALLDGLSGLYLDLARRGLSPALSWGLQAGLCAAVLLPSAALMGGSLPALARHLTRAPGRTQAAVSSCYAVNSAGAAVGALLAGLWLVPAFGLTWPVFGAAGLNLLVGAAALWIARDARPAATPEGSPVSVSPKDDLSSVQLRVLYAAAFFSGAAALAYEVAWTRLLAVSLGSSVYAFSLMLAAFIAGISLGGALARRPVPGGLGPLAGMGLAQAGVALAVILTLPLYERLPYLHYLAAGMLRRTDGAFLVYQGFQLAVCFLLMLVPTVFMGMSLPWAAAAAARRLSRMGTQVGGVFGLNSLGSVLGAAAAGLVLLPVLGLERLILACVLVNLALAAAVGWTLLARPVQRGALLAGCAAAALWAAFGTARGWDRLLLSAGEFRGRLSYDARGFPAYRERFRKQTLLFCRDDGDATVTVVKDGDSTVLKTNGKSDASTGDDLPTEILSAQLPLILRPGAREVLVVGLGSGITAGSVLTHPVARLDLVEISRGVVEAERFFREHNGRPRDDPRLALHVEDAKTFLQLSPRRYDLIVSEPSNPWIAGVGNLFSVDYYREARARLAPGGLMVQWFHLYEMDDDTLRLLLRTFCSQFAQVTLWEIPPSKTDILLIGSDAPLPRDFGAMESEFGRPAVAKDLSRLGISRLTTLLALQSASGRTVRELAGSGRVNEDQFPLLEYAAPKALFRMGASDLVLARDERLGSRSGQSLALARRIAARGGPLSREEFAELAGFQTRRGGALAVPLLREWSRRFPTDARSLRELARLSAGGGDPVGGLAVCERLLLLAPDDVEALNRAAGLELDLYLRGRSYLSEAKPDRALALLRRLAAKASGDMRAQAYQKLAEIHANTGSLADVRDSIVKAAAAAESGADGIWAAGARMALDRGDPRMARDFLGRALQVNPGNTQVRGLLQRLP
ncbi:MAG: fused MFS/spermidine synthase [Elusimicrobia bacterium]|nr:fused MFS/spermidine synthase [Elusimicrobiota bacterium]